MSSGARVAAFVALLAAIFASAALAGGALDPGGDDDRGQAAGHGGASAQRDGQAGEHGDGPADGADAARHEPAADAPAGVASTQDGLRLVVDRSRFTAGRAATLRFRILDAANRALRDFDVEQARRMHLIVVRRDLRRFQHLHPRLGSGGAWTVRLKLPEAGVYRAFADFRTGGVRRTLGIDLFVPGSFEPLDVPAPAASASVDGYDVALDDHGAGRLTFAVRRDGRAVADLDPYLGSRGHLVVLREGDLAYDHAHPVDGGQDEIAFETGSEPGTYRLFLQFRHRGRIRTAAFTRTVTR